MGRGPVRIEINRVSAAARLHRNETYRQVGVQHQQGTVVWLLLRVEDIARAHSDGSTSAPDARKCRSTRWKVVFRIGGRAIQVCGAKLQCRLAVWQIQSRPGHSSWVVVSAWNVAHGAPGTKRPVRTVLSVSRRGRETSRTRRFPSIPGSTTSAAGRCHYRYRGGGGAGGSGRSHQPYRRHPRHWRTGGITHATSTCEERRRDRGERWSARRRYSKPTGGNPPCCESSRNHEPTRQSGYSGS